MCAGPHSAQAAPVILYSQIWAMHCVQAACKQQCHKGCHCMDYHQCCMLLQNALCCCLRLVAAPGICGIVASSSLQRRGHSWGIEERPSPDGQVLPCRS